MSDKEKSDKEKLESITLVIGGPLLMLVGLKPEWFLDDKVISFLGDRFIFARILFAVGPLFLFIARLDLVFKFFQMNNDLKQPDITHNKESKKTEE